jgi:hypothetical protein
MKPKKGIKDRIRTRSGAIFLCLCIIFAGIVAMRASDADAQETTRGEYEVKAAFIYNFLKFVEWPDKAYANTGNSLNICIVGDDPFGNAITVYGGEKIRNKYIAIKNTSYQNIKNCHVVFISRSETEHLTHILKAMRGLNVLTISDTDTFEQEGVIINFSIVQQKVRFEINTSAARQSGLSISSKLLSLARVVYE